MTELTKKILMTTDTTSKISENPKKNKEIRRSNEGKQSKEERARTLFGFMGLSVVPQLQFTAIRCRQREQK